jgi:hypothetical protein
LIWGFARIVDLHADTGHEAIERHRETIDLFLYREQDLI